MTSSWLFPAWRVGTLAAMHTYILLVVCTLLILYLGMSLVSESPSRVPLAIRVGDHSDRTPFTRLWGRLRTLKLNEITFEI